MTSDKYSLSSTIKLFFPFFRPYLRKYVVAIVLLVLTIGLSLVSPLLFKIIIDNGIKLRNIHSLNMLAVALAVVLLLSAGVRGLMDYIHEWVSAWMIYDMRANLFSRIQNQSLEFFLNHKVGDMLTRLRSDIASVYSILVNTFLAGLGEVIQIIGIVICMFWLNYKLAIIALLFTPGLYVTLKVTGKKIRQLSLDLRDKDATLLEFFHEILSNMAIVKLYSREEFTSAAHSHISNQVIRSSLHRLRYKFLSIFLIAVLTGLAPIIFIWYGGRQVINGYLSFGGFIAFYLYAVRFYAPIQSLANRGVEIYNGLASAQRIGEYFELQSSIAEPQAPIFLQDISGGISFEGVSFRYPGATQNALTDVSFRIKPCEKIAVVGPSGAGKSTMINLLCRLYDASSGQIEVDGYDVKTVALRSLRNEIGVISQELFLFNDSILNNIKFARPDATDQEVVAAAKAAHLDSLIGSLPDGYKTIIGSRGLKLSGGQRQRIALARVVLKNPKIWFLDEFTSSLDSQTEALIYESIAPLLQNKTAITITHRLSTAMLADRIIVMHDGRSLETGTHASLCALNGLYRKLFDAQMCFAADAI